MSVTLLAKNVYDISWKNPRAWLRRLKINHAAKQIARRMQFSVDRNQAIAALGIANQIPQQIEATLAKYFSNPKSKNLFFRPKVRVGGNLRPLLQAAQNRCEAEVEQFLSNSSLKNHASYLLKHGITQINKDADKTIRFWTLCSPEDIYLNPGMPYKPQQSRIALVHKTPNPQDLPSPRLSPYLGANGQAYVAPASTLLTDRSRASAFSLNVSLNDGWNSMYHGPASAINPEKPNVRHPVEGDLSVLSSLFPPPSRWEQRGSTTSYPDIVLVDAPAINEISGPNGMVSAGLIGSLNFGLRSVNDLRVVSAQVVRGQLHDASKYVSFQGQPIFIQNGGDLFVGERRLADQSLTAGAPFYIQTKPIDPQREVYAQNNPVEVALVNKATGKVKYILPAKTLPEQKAILHKKFSAKASAGVAGHITFPWVSQARPEQAGTYAKIAQQDDIWETEWEIVEVVPQSFVASKELLQRLTTGLRRLSDKYRQIAAGKEMARILRQNGNSYSLASLVYKALFSSDRGDVHAGFVGKFSELFGRVDPRFMQDVYDLIKTEVFEGQKPYAINLGRAAKAWSFTDQEITTETGQKMLLRGEFNLAQITGATINPSRRMRGSWTYWRQLLGIPTTRRSYHNAYVGSFRWYMPQDWYGGFRRDRVLIGTTADANLQLEGAVYAIGTHLTANQPVSVRGPLTAIWSRATLGGQSDFSGGLFLHNYANGGTNNSASAAFTDPVITASGYYATAFPASSLPGSGTNNPPLGLSESYPAPATPRTSAANTTNPIRRDKYKPHIIGKEGHLSPDQAAQRVLRDILQKNETELSVASSEDPGRFFPSRTNRRGS